LAFLRTESAEGMIDITLRPHNIPRMVRRIAYPICYYTEECQPDVPYEKRKSPRVRRIRGQVEAVERALENEEGCATVLHLITAARGAINGLMAEVIEDHIRLHVVEPAKDAVRARGAEELIEAVQSYLK
jgi:DNA-binding FrmR family transcriptional regulator